MADYPELRARMRLFGAKSGTWKAVTDYLIGVWLADYRQGTKSGEIVETQASGFSYLFDIANERLLSAWGVSGGRHAGERDAARMAGHPKGGGALYHRGHAISHRMGGATDINLVPQLGSINVGPFRRLEKEAIAHPGSLYFTYWTYGPSSGQRPSGVDQGLLIAGRGPQITNHPN